MGPTFPVTQKKWYAVEKMYKFPSLSINLHTAIRAGHFPAIIHRYIDKSFLSIKPNERFSKWSRVHDQKNRPDL